MHINAFFRPYYIVITLVLCPIATGQSLECPMTSSNLPDMTLTMSPVLGESKIRFHNDTTFLFNGTGGVMLLTCSSSFPIEWEFFFDRLITYKAAKTITQTRRYWGDKFEYEIRRSFANLNDANTYKYSVDLKLWFFSETFIGKPISCKYIHPYENCSGQSVLPTILHSNATNAIEEEEGSVSTLFSLNSLAGPMMSPEIDDESAKCEQTHLVKELSPTKLQWTCVRNGTLATLWYGSTWHCKTITECTHFFYTGRMKKTCLKLLEKDEPCPGTCAVVSSLLPALMHCYDSQELDYQRLMPIVYSVSLRNGLPKRFYHWSWTTDELKEMIDFVPISSEVYVGDVMSLRCKVSEAYFAHGAKFAVTYANSTDLIVLDGENQTFFTHVNQRVYSLKLTVTDELVNVRRIFCLAPVWNSSQWINKSYPLTFLNRNRTRECGLKEDNPVINILPLSLALFSTPENLVVDGSNFSFLLNCTYKEPIKWKFDFEIFPNSERSSEIWTERKLSNGSDIFLISIKLFFLNPPRTLNFTCHSISNPCHRSTGNFIMRNRTTVISVSGVPDLKFVPRPSRKCRQTFYIRKISRETYEWTCRLNGYDYSGKGEKPEKETPCNDPLTCSNYYGTAINDDKCIRFLKPEEECPNCKSYPAPKNGKYFPRYLSCEINLARRDYQFAFYSVVKHDNMRNLYFGFSNANPEAMMELEIGHEEMMIYTGINLHVGCTISNFYFSKGAFLTIQTKSRRITFDDSTAVYDMGTNVRLISKPFILHVDDIGPVNITCFAPVITSTDWVNKSQTVVLKAPEKLHFTDNLTHTFVRLLPGDSHTLVCDVAGNPKPNVSWVLPQSGLLVEELKVTGQYVKLHLPQVKQFYTGVYKCTASNSFGTISKVFEVEVKVLSTLTIAIIGLTVALILTVLISALIHFIRRSRKLEHVVQILTEDEVTAFLTGEMVDRCGLHDSITPVFSIPYNTDLEIPREKIQIEEENMLGMGEFGMVFKGMVSVSGYPKLVAVKTSRQNIGADQMKAMLTEIKIMAHIGSHENIVQFLGACTANIRNGEVYIAIELCDKGNLRSFLVNHRKDFILDENESQKPYFVTVDDARNYDNISVPFSRKELYRWSFEIANGMAFLESKQVNHGDLATRNILLWGDLTVRISDFGLSRQLANYSSYVKTSHCALPWRWMSVEALRDMAFSIKSDCWAFGVTIWEIFTLGQIPYPGLAWDIAFVEQLQNGLRLPTPQYANQQISEIMIECWNPDPSLRPNFDILKEFFFHNSDSYTGSTACYANLK